MIQQDLCIGAPRFPSTVDQDAPDALQIWRRALGTQPLDALAAVGGDFAIGLTLSDGRTLLAVDRFAVRTLCWRIVDGRLRYAERADELADERHELDPQAIFDYLYFHAIPSPRTVFQGIFRLPPGHALLFENGQ
ncbi:MAG: asparagine synthase, partial [Rubrivivax sp.]|nr:asparagine synthase [Rubrivivax sp.]